MKATGQKMLKLKTKQVYAFKKENQSNGANLDPTTITSSGCFGLANAMVRGQVV